MGINCSVITGLSLSLIDFSLFFFFLLPQQAAGGGRTVVQQVSQDRSDHVHTSASAMSESFTASLHSHRPHQKPVPGWGLGLQRCGDAALPLSRLPPGCLMSVQATHRLCFLSAHQSSPDRVFPEFKRGNRPNQKPCAAPRAAPDPRRITCIHL